MTMFSLSRGCLVPAALVQTIGTLLPTGVLGNTNVNYCTIDPVARTIMFSEHLAIRKLDASMNLMFVVVIESKYEREVS